MKQFETFGEYMFDLLFAPLKKGRKTVNQLRIFFKVMGREFDDLKAAIFRVRSEANVASCSEVMLPVHGQDRDMPRLEGEDAEAYRTRLSMKGIISQWSGTRRGVLYALTALGYDRSRIELFADQDAERWAEFIIFLNSSKPSGVTNLSVIDGQVRKVKEGSSKPAYGMETIGGLIIQSRLQTGFSRYPRCGEIVCGVWPHRTTRAALKLHDAEAIFNEVSARVWDNFKATRRTIRAELEQAVRAANIANPDAIDNNALELMKTGVLSPADYSAFMERFDSNHTMLKLVGHYAAEAAKTTDSRREAAALNAIALDCQSGEGAVMRAWDSISAISDSCGDGDGYRRKSPGVIVSMSEKWDDLAGEAVENF